MVNARFRRKAERGTTVVVVVMVTTLISAIGVFAVRNISQIDQAVGYSRQAAQTNALAELGTTAAMAQIGATSTAYSNQMSLKDASSGLPKFKCLANGPYATAMASTCYPLGQSELEQMTTSNNGETLVEPAVAGSESGSFGPLANTTGFVNIELTEKRPTNTPIAGANIADTAFDVTLTTTAAVSPITSTSAPCGDGVASMTVKRVMRAHVIIPPDPGT